MFGHEFIGNLRLALILCVGFGVAALLFLLPTLRTDSKVVERSKTTGRIVSIATIPMDTKYSIGRGFTYLYVIELSDSTYVRVRDSAKFPHSIGSQVALERATRDNGTRFYMFDRPGNAYVPYM